MNEIRHLLVIHASPQKVYHALVEQTGLASWWTNDVKAKPEENSIAEFNFGDRYHNEMFVKQLEKNRRVYWECRVGDPEWIGTTFSFDLEKRGTDTLLRFCHGNWREMTDFFASCNYNWGYYLGSLKKYCEEGKGYPFTDRE